MSRRAGLALALSLAVLALPGMAWAQSERGREFDRLMRQAAQAYEAHDSRAAVQALERAYAIRPVPRLLFNLGRAHEQGGDYATAVDYYRRFLATNPDRETAAVAQEALGIAERQAAAQAEARRQQDAAAEAERQRALEEARIRAAAEEQRRAEEERRRQLALTVTTTRRVTTPVLIAWGVGGAALVTGGVLGALALSARSSFEANRDGDSRYDASSRGSGVALGADIAFGAAVAAGVTGLVLFLTQPTAAPAATETSQ